MKTPLVLFFVFIAIFVVLVFLGPLDIREKDFFLGEILADRNWQYAILGACLFICGKQVIDEGESKVR